LLKFWESFGLSSRPIWFGIEKKFLAGGGAPRLLRAFTLASNSSEFDANVKALKEGVALRPQAKEFLSQYQTKLAGMKGQTDSPEFQQLDAKLTAYEEGKLPLPDYVIYLDSVVSAATPELRKMVEAALIEGTINFSKVESERSRLLEKLVANMKESDIKI